MDLLTSYIYQEFNRADVTKPLLKNGDLDDLRAQALWEFFIGK